MPTRANHSFLTCLTWLAIGSLAAMAAAACGGDDNGGGQGGDDGGVPFDASSSSDAHVGFDAAHDAPSSADAGADSAADSGSDAASDSAVDAAGDASSDAGADAAHDAAVDASVDAALDAAIDSSSDAPAEASAEAGSDAAADAAADAPSDATADAATDATAGDSGVLDAGANDSGSNDAASDADAGATPTPVVLLVAGGTGGTLLASLTPGGAWSSSTVSAPTVEQPSVTALSRSSAIAAIRYTKLGDTSDNAVEYATWTPSGWAPFASIGGGAVARSAPSLGAAQLAFQGADYKYYHSVFSAGAWSAVDAVNQYGPVAPSIAATGGDATLAFLNGASSNSLTTIADVAGSWQAPAGLYNDTNFNVAPTIAALTTGSDLAVAWVRGSDAQVLTAFRTGGVWSSAQSIPNASSGTRVAIAPLADGTAIAAFRGNDSNIYVSLYTTAHGWTQAAALASPNVSIVGAPALAIGASGATAEIAFVQTSDGAAYHARLVGGSFTAPALVGGSGLSGVAIASAP